MTRTTTAAIALSIIMVASMAPVSQAQYYYENSTGQPWPGYQGDGSYQYSVTYHPAQPNYYAGNQYYTGNQYHGGNGQVYRQQAPVYGYSYPQPAQQRYVAAPRTVQPRRQTQMGAYSNQPRRAYSGTGTASSYASPRSARQVPQSQYGYAYGAGNSGYSYGSPYCAPGGA
ncbi:hypothetical protein ACFL2Q_17020 [Thermodesulfobacteriota bacterium]